METSHPHSPALIPPVATVLAAIVSAQGGAAIAKGLFPVLGAPTTAGLRQAPRYLVDPTGDGVVAQ